VGILLTLESHFAYRYQMVTIKDVAFAANCSTATVSRALAGRGGVPERTRLRVETAARQVGYQPNGLARALREGRSRRIGLVVPGLGRYNYAAGIALLHNHLVREGYSIVLYCHNDDQALEAEALRALTEQHVDAIIYSPCTPAGAEAILGRDAEIPIIEFHRRSRSKHVDAVIANEAQGSFEVARYLLSLGHERIAIIAGRPEFNTARGRIDGFVHAIRDAGLSSEECPVLAIAPNSAPREGSSWGQEATQRLVANGLESAPTAIYASSATIALGVLQALRDLEIEVPKSMSVVGFSDPPWYTVSTPPLSSYVIPVREMGLAAAQLVLNRLQPEVHGDLQPSVMSFSGLLVIRQSTSKPRSKGATVRQTSRRRNRITQDL
jgi:DNA-binding LacI/PurR family transcriptional regulator